VQQDLKLEKLVVQRRSVRSTTPKETFKPKAKKATQVRQQAAPKTNEPEPELMNE
jgi:hypothetical protein